MEGRRIIRRLTANFLVITLVFLVLIGINIFRHKPTTVEKTQAASWYDYDWQYRTAITVDNTKVDADLTDFPVLISSTNADWADTSNSGHAEQSDGGDFIFTTSDNLTVLPHEIEYYDNTTGQLVAWVKVPTVANTTDTVINLYFGNVGCANQWNVVSTWSGYNNIWHMTDDPSAGTLTDSTGALNGTVVGSWVAGDRTNAKINQGWNFSGTNDEEVNLGDIDASVTTQFTFSSWFKADATAQDGHRIIGNPLDINGPAIILYANVLYYRMAINGGAVVDKTVAFTDTASYHHVVFTWDGSNTHSYLDGAELTPAVAAVTYGDSTGSILGGRGAADQNFDGMIDEVRFDNTAKSAEWVSTEYNNQNSPATFYSLAEIEQGDSTPPTNVTTVSGYNTSGKTDTLTSGNWDSYNTPYFEFSGAADAESGVAGYYVYFDTDSGADPEISGDYQAHVGAAGATQSYTSSISMSAGNTYYLILKTKNGANLISSAGTVFTYSYDPTAPSAPEYVNVSPVGCSTQTSFTFTWPAASDIGGSSLSGYQYKRGSTGTINNIDSLTTTASTYQEGDNVFYIRSIDNAGNTSSWQTAIYCSTAVVSLTDGPTVSAGPSSITVTWTSSKTTTGYVKVYDGNTYVSEQGLTSYSQVHSVKVIGLEPEKAYRYQITWTDESGNLGESEWYTTTTATAPQINNLAADIVSPTTVNISWSSTIPAHFSLEYGLGDYSNVMSDTNWLTGYSTKISNLTAGGSYQLRVNATSQDGTKFFAGKSFSMPPLPSIASLKTEEVPDQPSTTLKISWSTNVATTSSLYFGPKGETKKEVSSSEMVTDHEQKISDLIDNSEYEYYASGIDNFGNVVKSNTVTYRTAMDSRAPKISDISIETSNVGLGQVDKAQVATAYRTDEPASCIIEYGEGISGSNYTGKTQADDSYSNSHLTVISDLTPQLPYHLRISCHDHAGNTSYSSDQTLISGEAPKSVFNVIIKTLSNIFGWLSVFTK